MAINSAIRERLLKKMAKSTLSERASAVRLKLPMSVEDSYYVVAHQEAIPIERHLDRETVGRIQQLVVNLREGASVTTARAKHAKEAKSKRSTVVKIGTSLDTVPGMTPTHAQEAKRMAEVYPVLYVFENSARDIIAKVLKNAVGSDWWDKIIKSRDIRDKVEYRRTKEKEDPWHSKRGAHPIFYTDLSDLAAIVRTSQAWPHFKKLFGKQTFFDGIVDNLSVSRNVVAHMNPLTPDDIQQVEAGFKRWKAQLEAKKAELP